MPYLRMDPNLMKGRALLLTFAFVFLVALTILTPGYYSVIFFVVAIVALGGLLSSLTEPSRFKVAKDQIVVDNLVSRAEKFGLENLVHWRMLSYNIRGRTIKTLILLFDGDRKVNISSQFHPEDFDEVLQRLTEDHHGKKLD